MSEPVEPAGGPAASAVRRVFAQGSAYTVATAAQILAALLAVPIATRLLTPEDFGIVAVGVVVTQVAGYVVSLGISSATSHEVFVKGADGAAGPDVDDGARGLIGGVVVVAVLVTALLDLTGYAWAGWFFSDLGFGGALRVATWTAVPFAVALAAQLLLRARHRVTASVAVALWSSAGAHLFGLAAIAMVRATATAYLVGLLLGWAMAALVGVLRTGINARFFTDRDLRARALRIGLPTVPHLAAVYVLAAGDRVVIERLLGLEQVARYQVAYQVGAMGISALVALNYAWQPIVYDSPSDGRLRVLAETTAAVYRIVPYVAAGIAFAAPVVLRLATPASYDSDGLVLTTAIVAATAVAYVAYLSAASMPLLHGRTTIFAWATPLAAAVNIGLNVLLVERYGLPGAAVATVAAYALLAAAVRWRLVVAVPWIRGAAPRAWLATAAVVTLGALAPTDGAGVFVRALGVAAALLGFVREGRRALKG